jgi:pimeloyl-ACP methyl ester carboxylesterase
MTKLVEDGHELYALDWLGHGRSDKPTQRESITFELHMRTLSAFFNHAQLSDAILVAHSWGG